MNKEHIKQLAEDFSGDYDCMCNNDAVNFALQFVESLIEKGEVVEADDFKRYKEEYKGEADLSALCCAVSDVEIEHDKINTSNEKHIASLEKQVAFYVKLVDKFIDKQPATPAKVISDEEIKRYITAAHPDTVGNTPIQLLMAEKIRISLEWYREQLTGE